MKRIAATAAVTVALLASGCGGASQEQVDRLEARVAALEERVDELESEIGTLRQLEGAVQELMGFADALRDRIPDLDSLGDLLDTLRSVLP